MKAVAGFNCPENILLKFSEDILRVASASTGALPAPQEPAPFFKSRKYSFFVSVNEKLNTESVFLISNGSTQYYENTLTKFTNRLSDLFTKKNSAFD